MFNDDFDDLVINDENLLDTDQVLQPLKIMHEIQSNFGSNTGHISNADEF